MRGLEKSLLLLSVVPVAFAGCTSTNPKAAFDDVGQQVAARAGYETRWMRDDAEQDEIGKAVAVLLRTNLTAPSAVAVALLNNRSLQAQFEDIGISQADLSAASRLRNPEFEGMWRLPTHGPKVVNAEYTLAQNFLDLLTLPGRKQIASRNLEATKLRIAHQVLALAAAVQGAFYKVQAGEQLTNRLAVVVEVNEAGADLAQRQHDAGNINDLELHHQQATYAQSRLELAHAQVQLRADREKCNRLLGLWGGQTPWQTAGSLAPLPEQEIPVENVEALAIAQRLDLAAARGEVVNVQSALKLKKSVRWIPGASIGVSAEHDLDHSWVVGPTLSFEVPLFDQGQPEIARLAAAHRRAMRTLEALAVNVRSEVREARDALIAARDVVDYHQQVLLPQRQRILRETLLQYNAMQKSNYELLLAKEREQQEVQAAIEALRDYWIARAELERAVGGSLSNERLPAPASAKTDTKKPEAHEHDQH
ncbi:MAG TPA: TolC family protein [Verrucomicrobiae bacterium]|nr:TolC family protein [Verrucomicrobiae bacterium]